MRRLLLGTLALALSSPAAVAQQFAITPEAPVSAPSSTVVSGNHSVIVATNEDFVDVWMSPTELRATRITADGVKIDAVGVPVSIGKIGPSQSGPAVVFNGATLTIFWTYFDVIYATEVTPDLQVLQQDRPIANVGGYEPRVAWDGARYLIVAGAHRIVVSRALDVLVDALRTDTPLVGEQLASDGNSFVLVGGIGTATPSATTWRVVAQQLNSDGTAVGGQLELDGAVSDPFQIAIAASRTGYLAAWQRAGLQLARMEVPLAVTAHAAIATVNPFAPKVVWDGSNFVAAWLSEDNPPQTGSILTASFAADLSSGAAAPDRIATVSWEEVEQKLSLAAAGSSTFVTWSEISIKTKRFGMTGEPMVISNAAAAQGVGAVARSSMAATAAWFEGNQGYPGFGRVATIGTPSAIPFDFPGAVAEAVASDGNDFLVVSAAGSSISARIVHGDGSSGSPIEIAMAKPATLAAEWDGSEYVVAWPDQAQISIVRLNGDAGILGRFDIQTTAAAGPALACGSDGQCVLGWTIGSLVETARLDRFSVIDQMPVIVATSAHWIQSIAVARGTTESLVTWTEVTNTLGVSIVGSEIHAARFADGAPLGTASTDDGFLVDLGTQIPRVEGLKPFASGYALLWFDGLQHLFLTRLDPHGLPDRLSTTNIVPEAAIGAYITGSLGDPSVGRLPIIYARPTSDPLFGSSRRVFYREAFTVSPRVRAVR